MNAFRQVNLRFLVIITGIALAAYVLAPIISGSGTIRYRLTVEVEDGRAIKSASGVIEVTYTPAGHIMNIDERADSVAVDLGAKGVLLMLVDGSPPVEAGRYRASFSAMPIKEFHIAPSIGAMFEGDTLRDLWKFEGKTDVPFERLTLLARLADPLDPVSAERVDPNNLEDAFGTGVRLVRVAIETTHAAPTFGLKALVPWVDDYAKASVAYHKIIDGLGWGSYEPTQLFLRR